MTSKPPTLKQVEAWALDQLKPTGGSGTSATWTDILIGAHRSASKAGDDAIERRRWGGHIGGIQRRWRAELIRRLTSACVPSGTHSRDAVRLWQKTTFGYAASSRSLAVFARPDNSGGGRPGALSVSPETQREALRLYEAYANELGGPKLHALLHPKKKTADVPPASMQQAGK